MVFIIFYRHIFYLFGFFLISNFYFYSLSAESLANLQYNNPTLHSLRNEVKHNLRVSHSKNSSLEFHKLKFYYYKVQKTDHFFYIMAKTSMDMDTLLSVNDLSSPYDLTYGQILKIPNVRGIYYRKPCELNCLEIISKEYNIDSSKILYDDKEKLYFIPGGKIENKEKMFFLGKAFSPPLESYILTSQFGKRLDPFTKKETFHGGVDLAAPEGSPVYAAADGIVEFVGKKGGYGNLIILRHDHGYETRYGHLKQFEKINGKILKKGNFVKKGDKIGLVGKTGRATGYHLHFEVRKHSKPEFPKIH